MVNKEKDKLKISADNKPALDAGNTDDAANVAAKGAVLPDPEEIKMPRPHKPEEHRTVIDGGKPKENNTKEDSDEYKPFDYRGNK
ncbi:MAG: hypothetical protein J7621_11120 [Niastella sp.]|nr:hypothetical protein [Niastella sp.]